MNENDDLIVFQLGDDLVIAKDREDALVVWQEVTGEDWRDYYDRGDLSLAQETLSIFFIEHEIENTKLPPDGIVKELSGGKFTVKAPAKSWAKCYGRGLLAGGEI